MKQDSPKDITACPLCESQSFDDTIDGVAEVCDSCGLIVSSDMPQADFEAKFKDENSTIETSVNWMGYCAVRNATEHHIAEAFDQVEQIGGEFDLSSKIRLKAADVYADAFKHRITEGRNAGPLVVACTRVACDELNYSIPERRLVESINTDIKQYRSYHRTLLSELDIRLNPSKPLDFLPFLSDLLELDDKQLSSAESVIQEVTDSPAVNGRDPAGIAAASIYWISSEHTQVDVADAAGVSTETIRVRSNDVEEVVVDG